MIHFDVGFKKAKVRCTATQILEAVKGKITIMKFMAPGIAPAMTANETYLADCRKGTDAMFQGKFQQAAQMVGKA